MRIIEIAALKNGAHRNQMARRDISIPNGWAVIPDDMVLENFPFGEVAAEEVTYYREIEVEKEVIKTREVESFDEEGNPITVTEEYTELEIATEQEPYTVMTVTGWVAGTIPEVEEPEPTSSNGERITALEEENELLKAQINAQSEQMDFYEDCIAEMAMIVYA